MVRWGALTAFEVHVVGCARCSAIATTHKSVLVTAHQASTSLATLYEVMSLNCLSDLLVCLLFAEDKALRLRWYVRLQEFVLLLVSCQGDFLQTCSQTLVQRNLE